MSETSSGPVLACRRTDLAQDFLLEFARTVLLHREYAPTSELVQGAASKLYDSFTALSAHLGNIEIRIARDMLRVNQYLAHVRGHPGGEDLDGLILEFREMGLGSIVVAQEAPPDAFGLLTGTLAHTTRLPAGQRLTWLMDEIARQYPESLDVIASTAFEEVVIDTFETGEETRDDVVLRLYCYLQALARYVQGDELPPGEDLEREIHLGVSRLADLCATHRDAVLACVAAVVPFGSAMAEHAANRAFLAAALAQRASLDDRSVRMIADAALHADAGLALLSDDLQEVHDPLEESGHLHQVDHTLLGASQALERGGPRASVRARAVVALEHHAGARGGGFPALQEPPHLFSRICAIADIYAALTHERPDRAPLPPPEALRILETDFRDTLDPNLVKAFAGMLGPYPPGTPVLLDTGESGVVRRNSEDPARPDKPVVLVVGDPEDWYRSAVEVDLLHDPGGGSVVGVLHRDELPFATAAVYFKPEMLYET